VVVDDRLKFVVDMYTITSRYPYSQPWTFTDSERLARSTGLPQRGPNYIRNSVKATVDAYDGTVTFYMTDDAMSDPIIESWAKAYPSLLADESEMPASLVEHLRFPKDMFTLQTERYLEYHVTDPDEFFTGVDAWSIPTDPSTMLRSGDRLLWGDSTATDGVATSEPGYLPLYLTLDLPGDESDELSYVLMQPFNALDRPNMTSFLVADSSPGRYGRLVEYRLPRGSLVEGANQVGLRIDQDDDISSQFTLWRGQGSTVLLGDMLVVPINESILYVQPVYLEAASTAGGLPEFRRVVVVYGDRIEWAGTLQAALAAVFDQDPDTPTVPDGGNEGEPDLQVPENYEDLVQAASDALADAGQALANGNLGEYQTLVEQAADYLERAQQFIEENTSGDAGEDGDAGDTATTTTAPAGGDALAPDLSPFIG
jgi:hypothetical protein